MRKDMNKVLTERPRAGHSRNYHEVRAAQNRGDLEDLPHCQGMRAPYDYSRKEFTDLLGPLYRFMHGCIGRRYDDVWSEICKAVPSGNTVDEHLKGHARDIIEHQTYINDGEIYVRGRRYREDYKPDGLYVDPRDGIIYDATKRVSKKKQNETKYFTNIGTFKRDEYGVYQPYHYYSRYKEEGVKFCLAFFNNEQEAIKMKGIWYWIVFATVPPAVKKFRTNEETGVTTSYMVDSWKTDWVYQIKKKSGERYRHSKVQMNCRDLKNHGLVND